MHKIFKLFIASLTTVLVLVGVGFGLHFFRAQKKEHARSARFPVTEEKPFAIVIPSYNNTLFCEQNLRSVLEQNYTNYRVIYIDDCSTDNTYEKVKDLVSKSPKASNVTLIRNEKNRGALANLYHAIHSCEDHEIVICVDGDDFLAHPNVLNKLNQTYANPDVWMTYGNYLDYPAYRQKPLICKKIPDKITQNNRFRSHEWVTSHLRTFYAGLFKEVRLQHFLYNGRFLPMAWDLAFMLPMLEMSGKHVRFIRETLYLYNRSNPINDHKINLALQQACDKHVRSLSKYKRLKALAFEKKAPSADLVVFSYDRPMQLYAFLESLQHVSSLGKVSVIYRSSDSAYAAAYDKVKASFAHVNFMAQAAPFEDFQHLVFHAMESSSNPYILFAVDDIVVKDKIDLKACIAEMEKTKAYGFYLGYGTHLTDCYTANCKQPLPPTISLDAQTFAWQFKDGVADWAYPNSLDMVLYSKEQIRQELHSLTFNNPNTLESAWAKKAHMNRVGLFYKDSKVVNIPLNLVNTVYANRHMQGPSPKELLQRFEQNQKIDITPLYQIQNPSRHIEVVPVFIPRG